MNNFKTEAFILSMGIFLSGVCVKKAVRQFSDSDRVVTVKGLSEREVPANKVVWPLVYKEMGNDPAEMYENIQAKNRQVVKFLKDHGISEAEISQNSPIVTDRKAESYEQNIPYRYIATSVTTVTSDKVELVRKIMRGQSELMKLGIALVTEMYGPNTVTYEFTGLNDIKPDMIEESTKNARATAEKFAKDSDSELGKIKKASQGQFSIEDRDANTPHIKRIRVVSTVEYYIED